jgi:hypothetical protein
MMSQNQTTFRHDAGIAIGPILFIIAILGILGAVLAAGSGGSLGNAQTADRITADIVSQANLIRTKILECNLIRGNGGSNYFPTSDTTNGTPVADVECAGDTTGQKNLWSGVRATMLPQPTSGLNAWTYINTDASGTSTASGGRCIWTTPVGTGSAGIIEGLTKAASKFTHSTTYSSSAEVIYDPGSVSQKFVVWISLPTGSANSNCLP